VTLPSLFAGYWCCLYVHGCLCSRILAFQDVAAASAGGATNPTALLGGVDTEAAAILASYQAKVTNEVTAHEKRVWQEMDPSTARELQQAENEVK